MTEVAWVAPTYPWIGDPSVGVFYRTQAQALSRAGQQLTVICPTPWAPWPLRHLRRRWRTHAAAPRRAMDGSVTILRPRYPNVPGEPSWGLPDRAIAATAWRARGEWRAARLLHGHYAVTGLATWRLARKAGLPYVLTFHGSDINVWPGEHPDRLAELRTAIREAAAVIAVSGALGDRIRELSETEATVLPLGSDHRWIQTVSLSRAEARVRLGLPADRPIALFIGHLKAAKGVRELADAVLALDGAMLAVFVGDGPELGYGSERDPGDRIRYVGARPHEDAIRFASAADVLVLPSFSEGLPTVIVEAGSLALPVIASRVGGIPELLGEGRGTMIDSISAHAVETALRTFLADPEAARGAGRRLQSLVLDRYDVEHNTQQLVGLYAGIAG